MQLQPRLIRALAFSATFAALASMGSVGCGGDLQVIGLDEDGGADALVCTAGKPAPDYTATEATSDVKLCPASCYSEGGKQVCPCEGATAKNICGFAQSDSNGHAYRAQCDLNTGRCECEIDEAPTCSCQAMVNPIGVCDYGSDLNCCF